MHPINFNILDFIIKDYEYDFRLTPKRYLILGLGLEPCDYIRGFILSIKLFIENSTYNKIGYIEILTDNIEETKKFYSTMCGWEYEKSENKE